MKRQSYEPIVQLAHEGISGRALATRCDMLLLRDKASIALVAMPNAVSRDQYRAVVEIVTNWWAEPLTDDALKSFYRGAQAMMKAATETDAIHQALSTT
jgi:hypothetical protein